MSLKEHYARVYFDVRREGFHEPISLAPNWQARADALYGVINAAGHVPSGIGLLKDGRMAAYARDPLAETNLYALVELAGQRACSPTQVPAEPDRSASLPPSPVALP